ncbi:MAG TPA: hypothetical protein VF021_10955 [Longimicrobiales bacterium]
MKMWQIAPVLFVLAACASSQTASTAATGTTPAAQPATPAPAPAALDPTGAYDFATVANGQTVTGTLYITGTPGAYTGRIVTNTFPEIPVTAATVAGQAVDVKASMPDGELAIHFVMDGMNFTGNWTLGADSGEFNGKKLPKQ